MSIGIEVSLVRAGRLALRAKETGWTLARATLKLQEELGEFAEQVNLLLGSLPGKASADLGPTNEAADVLVEVFDILAHVFPRNDPNILVGFVRSAMVRALDKWEGQIFDDEQRIADELARR